MHLALITCEVEYWEVPFTGKRVIKGVEKVLRKGMNPELHGFIQFL